MNPEEVFRCVVHRLGERRGGTPAVHGASVNSGQSGGGRDHRVLSIGIEKSALAITPANIRFYWVCVASVAQRNFGQVAHVRSSGQVYF